MSMRILVSGATPTVAQLAGTELGRDHLGVLYTPQNGNLLGSVLRCGLPWACDNSAFSNPDDRKFWNMGIDAWEWEMFHPPLWVTVPDVVGSHSGTLELFDSWVQTWLFEIGRIPFPIAFVLQNGATIQSVPWDSIEAVFVGGDDHFKLHDCHDLIDEAKSRGKLVHIGRVNSLTRLRYALDIGADSIDGSGFSMFPEVKIKRALQEIKRLSQSQLLFG